MMDEREQIEKAWKMVKEFHTAMLVTHAPDETLVARPMSIAHADDDYKLTFISNAESPKVDEALRNSAVAVTMQSGQAFVAVSGQANVVADPKEKERVWSVMSNVWFDGPRDASAVLIQVIPDVIEYWDNRGLNGLRFTVQAARALVSGKEPHASSRQHSAVSPEAR